MKNLKEKIVESKFKKTDFNNDFYNVVSDLFYEYRDDNIQEKNFDEAVENFKNKFFEK